RPLSLPCLSVVSSFLYMGQDLRRPGTDTDMDTGELSIDNARGQARFRNGGWRRYRGLDFFRLFFQDCRQEIWHRNIAVGNGTFSADKHGADSAQLARRARHCKWTTS